MRLTRVIEALKRKFGPQVTLLVLAGKKTDFIQFTTARHYRNIRNEILLDALADQKRLLDLQGRSTSPIIFDVGANIGQTAKTYHDQIPTAIIYSFEPFEEAFSHLQTVAASIQNLIPFQYAISSRNGTSSLYISEHSVMNSLLQPNKVFNTSFAPNEKTVTVETVTLDHFCHKLDISFIDILKLDVQGTELDVLQGAKQLLSEQRIGMVYTELQHRPLYHEQTKYYEVISFLDQTGYTLFNFYNTVYSKRNGQFSWCDAIFVNRDLSISLG